MAHAKLLARARQDISWVTAVPPGSWGTGQMMTWGTFDLLCNSRPSMIQIRAHLCFYNGIICSRTRLCIVFLQESNHKNFPDQIRQVGSTWVGLWVAVLILSDRADLQCLAMFVFPLFLVYFLFLYVFL